MMNPSFFFIVVVLVVFGCFTITVSAAVVSLGRASSYAVLAGTTVTNTGSTIVTGDVGVSAGTAVTGFPPGQVLSGTIHSADTEAANAQTDLITAYDAAAGAATTTDLSSTSLTGLTLAPGVYSFSSTASLTGTLTLNFQNNPNAEFIFQITSSLITAPSSTIALINTGSGGGGCQVWWQVGSSATIDVDTTFYGTILALTSITLNTGADILDGGALARNGQVSLEGNTITQCAAAAPTTPTTPTPTPTEPPAGGRQDPQFTGFHGQSYQIHGSADDVYSIITSPSLQLNSRFVYLMNGKCTYTNTPCYTHPGTYFGGFGILLKSSNHTNTAFRIEIESGSHDIGLSLIINGKQMISPFINNMTQPLRMQLDVDTILTWSRYDEITLHTPLLMLQFINSDDFINLGASLLDVRMLEKGKQVHHHHHHHDQHKGTMHGLLGQTWQRGPTKYSVEGDVSDYLVNTLLSTPGMYNLY